MISNPDIRLYRSSFFHLIVTTRPDEAIRSFDYFVTTNTDLIFIAHSPCKISSLHTWRTCPALVMELDVLCRHLSHQMESSVQRHVDLFMSVIGE